MLEPNSPSRSAMNVFAPEFNALMTIFLSVGPVISTLETCQLNSMVLSFLYETVTYCSEGLTVGPRAQELVGRIAKLGSRGY